MKMKYDDFISKKLEEELATVRQSQHLNNSNYNSLLQKSDFSQMFNNLKGPLKFDNQIQLKT